MYAQQWLSSYVIEELLGSGGMGEVYRAFDSRSEQKVALKVLHESFSKDRKYLKRFEAEAKAASSIDHPNVVRIFEVGESDGNYFIAMELVDGVTLLRRIQEGVIDSEEVLRIAVQVAEALARAHSAGVFHRDIKPSNIMITSAGSIKLLDFGLAKIIHVSEEAGSEDDRSTAVRTLPNMLFGTVPYLSPEQALGKPVDGRSDLFSLGVTLYHAATGTVPFIGRNVVEIIDQMLHVEPAPHSLLLNLKLRYVIQKCLRKNPEERYQSVQELLTDLSKEYNFFKRKKRTSSFYASFARIPVVARYTLLFIISLLLAGYLLFLKSPQLSNRYSKTQEAYELYLKGRKAWNRRTPDSIREAVTFMEAAVSKDPSSAAAYAGLALAYDMAGPT